MSLTETTKCTNCGASVPAEKAFCPNCSEPMEPEEAADRVDAMSSEMMSTVQDDPESYKQLLDRLKQGRAAARQQAQAPGPTEAAPPAAYNRTPAAPAYPAPPAKSGKLALVLGLAAAALLIIVLLFVFKVIRL